MSQARDLLTLLLATTTPSQGATNAENPPTSLTATIVTKPPPIQSVEAFNAQLVVGGKDKALRDAAKLFKTAADGMEKSRTKTERYFLDALKIRRGNWGLIPAPLPPGSAMGKGSDKTSKDFLVSFSLEECWYFHSFSIASSENLSQPHRYSAVGQLLASPLMQQLQTH